MTKRLTVANPELQARIDATPAGMMHWTATGPAGKRCFDCLNFDQRILRTKAERAEPELVSGACDKRQRSVDGQFGRRTRRHIYDPRTPACSHLAEPPPAEEA